MVRAVGKAGWIAAASSLVLVLAVTVAAGGPDKVTICHKPESEAKTLEVSEASWRAHRDHGDHRGPCADARNPHAGGPSPEVGPLATVSPTIEAEGDAQGDATFRITVRPAQADAKDVVVSGTFHGEGAWKVSWPTQACTQTETTFRCSFDAIPLGWRSIIDITFDGPPTPCGHAGLSVSATAANDDSTRDDAAREQVRVGACTLVPPG